MQDPVALYLIAFGGLLLAAVLLDDLADRVKLPGILLVLALGLLVDNDIRGGSEPLLSWSVPTTSPRQPLFWCCFSVV